jgi:hypothetical protein
MSRSLLIPVFYYFHIHLMRMWCDAISLPPPNLMNLFPFDLP